MRRGSHQVNTAWRCWVRIEELVRNWWKAAAVVEVKRPKFWVMAPQPVLWLIS